MWPIDTIRSRFPALSRRVDPLDPRSRPVVYFDGPAGSQTPDTVVAAVADYLLRHNANSHGPFATSRETDEIVQSTRAAATAFLGTVDPEEIVFGPNMTTLTFHVGRALSKTWRAGDEIILSSLDHDGNFTPWVIAAERAGASVKVIRLRPEDWTLDLDHYRSLLTERTRLVAVGMAANSIGTVNPVEEIVAAARKVGAITYLDAVHFAPHRRIDMRKIDADFVVCSAYKFFGPHVGILRGRRSLLESLQPDKLRPSPSSGGDRWMTGTASFEGIAGLRAAIEYLASLGDPAANATPSQRLDRAFERIRDYESHLAQHFLDGLRALDGFRLIGSHNTHDRAPTFSLVSDKLAPRELAERLTAAGVFCWAGNHYALPFTQAAGLEPRGTLRLGMLHYNTTAEIDRVLELLADM